MEVNSSSINQIQQSQPQPHQQQVEQQRAFEEDFAAQQQARQTVEETPASAPDENQNTTTDYTNLIREARAQQATVSTQSPAASDEDPQAQNAAVTEYQNNQETFEAPTSSGELQPRVDALI